MDGATFIDGEMVGAVGRRLGRSLEAVGNTVGLDDEG